jgi:hypothetical protein
LVGVAVLSFGPWKGRILEVPLALGKLLNARQKFEAAPLTEAYGALTNTRISDCQPSV